MGSIRQHPVRRQRCGKASFLLTNALAPGSVLCFHFHRHKVGFDVADALFTFRSPALEGATMLGVWQLIE
jgi:hypothetical protein